MVWECFTTRVRVNCWRKLAEGVAASVMVGDPVIVCGRLYTRDWTDDAGNHRTLYELEAVAVGHDLSRGRGRFLRNRPTTATSAVEDTEAEHRVHGEATEPVGAAEAPAAPDGRPFDDDFEPPGLPSRGRPAPLAFASADPLDGPSAGSDDFDAAGPGDSGRGDSGRGDSGPGDSGRGDSGRGGSGPGGREPDGASGPGPYPGDDSRLGSDAGPGLGGAAAPAGEAELAGEVELVGEAELVGASEEGVTTTARGRRGRGRVPAPA